MTTTIFRKSKNDACIASDSRVTWVNSTNNLAEKWFDCRDIKKNLMIDGVMYGFAGANAVYQAFLEYYTTLEESEKLLDILIRATKDKRIQFFMLRYDGENLKLFASSPESLGQPEIYKVSTDFPIDRNYYAIGSGRYSKQYKKHRLVNMANTPILKIIAANLEGMRKKGVLHLNEKAKKGIISPEESHLAYAACHSKGGDLFTGGDVIMCQNATRTVIDQQAKLLASLNIEAKANGSVCASPINAKQEVQNLRQVGHSAVSPIDVELSDKDNQLLKKLSARIDEIL